MNRLRFLAVAFALHSFALAQPPLSSPSVNPDGSLTFRYLQTAAKVDVHLDLYEGKPLPMLRDPDGTWSFTTKPLAPAYYGYDYAVDGKIVLDPLNSDVRPNDFFRANQVLVPGNPPAPWEVSAVPHGRVDHLRYTTHIVKHLPLDQSAYMVYTPPGYDPKRKGGYPVLYLLHGWSDRETAWTSVGRADLIMDSLIASGKAVPMIAVMPLGYGDMHFLSEGFKVWNSPATVDNNAALFTQALETEVMPAVESAYNIAPGRENHAIIGLSMGGLESLSIGLNHADQFAYVGGMSAAVHGESFDTHFAGIDAKRANLRLLWVACGVDDPLLTPNRHFVAWAQTKGFNVTPVETPGAHVWLVWRDNLVAFAPLLFRKQ